MAQTRLKFVDGKVYKLVFRKFIVKGGKRIYPKKARCFAFWVPVL